MTNLPDGVTHAAIDRHFGGERNDWPGYLDCEHEGLRERLYDVFDTSDRAGGKEPEEQDEWNALDNMLSRQRTTFEGHEVEDLSVWDAGSYYLTARWTCPVCGTKHENTEGFEPDPDADRD